MSPEDAARQLDQLARDLDLAVFTLERPAPAGEDRAQAERVRLRRELEALRERIETVARGLGG